MTSRAALLLHVPPCLAAPVHCAACHDGHVPHSPCSLCMCCTEAILRECTLSVGLDKFLMQSFGMAACTSHTKLDMLHDSSTQEAVGHPAAWRPRHKAVVCSGLDGPVRMQPLNHATVTCRRGTCPALYQEWYTGLKHAPMVCSGRREPAHGQDIGREDAQVHGGAHEGQRCAGREAAAEECCPQGMLGQQSPCPAANPACWGQSSACRAKQALTHRRQQKLVALKVHQGSSSPGSVADYADARARPALFWPGMRTVRYLGSSERPTLHVRSQRLAVVTACRGAAPFADLTCLAVRPWRRWTSTVIQNKDGLLVQPPDAA